MPEITFKSPSSDHERSRRFKGHMISCIEFRMSKYKEKDVSIIILSFILRIIAKHIFIYFNWPKYHLLLLNSCWGLHKENKNVTREDSWGVHSTWDLASPRTISFYLDIASSLQRLTQGRRRVGS